MNRKRRAVWRITDWLMGAVIWQRFNRGERQRPERPGRSQRCRGRFRNATIIMRKRPLPWFWNTAVLVRLPGLLLARVVRCLRPPDAGAVGVAIAANGSVSREFRYPGAVLPDGAATGTTR